MCVAKIIASGSLSWVDLGVKTHPVEQYHHLASSI
jgi:hypothetical protein